MTFVPHLLPVNRGILATCYARLAPGVTMETLREVYTQAYRRRDISPLVAGGKRRQHPERLVLQLL